MKPETIRKWLENGGLALALVVGLYIFLDEEEMLDLSLPVSPPIEDLSYTYVRKNIFEQHCLRCHGLVNGQLGGVDLSTYQGVKKNTRRLYLSAIVMRRMPPKPMRALTRRERTILKTWIDGGIPELVASGQKK